MTKKGYKLINCEEIIAEVFNYYHRHIELKTPATIVMQQTAQGMGVCLPPYMPYAKGNVDLHRQSIAAEAEPDVKIENEYSRIFGSGIQIASTF